MYEDIELNQSDLADLELSGVDSLENLYGVRVISAAQPLTFDLYRYSMLKHCWGLIAELELRKDRQRPSIIDANGNDELIAWAHSLNKLGGKMGFYFEARKGQKSLIIFAVIDLRSEVKPTEPLTERSIMTHKMTEYQSVSDDSSNIFWPCVFALDGRCSNRNDWAVCGRSENGVKIYLVDSVDNLTASFELQVLTEIAISPNSGIDVEAIGNYLFFQTHDSLKNLVRFHCFRKSKDEIKAVAAMSSNYYEYAGHTVPPRRYRRRARLLPNPSVLTIDDESILVSASNKIFRAHPVSPFLELCGLCLCSDEKGDPLSVTIKSKSFLNMVQHTGNDVYSDRSPRCAVLTAYWNATSVKVFNNSDCNTTAETESASCSRRQQHRWKLCKDIVPCMGSHFAIYMKLENDSSNDNSTNDLLEQKISAVFISAPSLEWLCIRNLFKRWPHLCQAHTAELNSVGLTDPLIDKYWQE